MLSLALLCLCGLLAASKAEVLVLNDDTFEDTKKEHPYLFVKMFAPWCGHCQRLAPTWEEISTDARLVEAGITVAEADCTEAGKKICGQHGVSGFPTIKLVSANGAAYDYDGNREKDDLVSWALDMLKPALVELPNMEAAREAAARAGHGTDVFFVFTGPELSEEFESFVGNMKGKMFFGFVKAEQKGLVVFREEEKIAFSGKKFDRASVSRFILDNRYPFLPEIVQANFGDFSRQGKLMAFVAYSKNDPDQEELVQRFRAFAKQVATDKSFEYAWMANRYALGSMDIELWEQFLEEPGYDMSHMPLVMIYKNTGRSPKYAAKVLESPETYIADISAFFSDYRAGRVRPQLFRREDREKAEKDKEL